LVGVAPPANCYCYHARVAVRDCAIDDAVNANDYEISVAASDCAGVVCTCHDCVIVDGSLL
jgi:hypothetical protein